MCIFSVGCTNSKLFSFLVRNQKKSSVRWNLFIYIYLFIYILTYLFIFGNPQFWIYCNWDYSDAPGHLSTDNFPFKITAIFLGSFFCFLYSEILMINERKKRVQNQWENINKNTSILFWMTKVIICVGCL